MKRAEQPFSSWQKNESHKTSRKPSQYDVASFWMKHDSALLRKTSEPVFGHFAIVAVLTTAQRQRANTTPRQNVSSRVSERPTSEIAKRHRAEVGPGGAAPAQAAPAPFALFLERVADWKTTTPTTGPAFAMQVSVGEADPPGARNAAFSGGVRGQALLKREDAIVFWFADYLYIENLLLGYQAMQRECVSVT